MPRIKCLNKKRDKKLIFNGRKNQSSQSQKLEKYKIKIKRIWQDKTGQREDNLDMDGEKINNHGLKEVHTLKTIKPKPSRKD